MRITVLAALLLVMCTPLTGCKRSLDTRDVQEFIDKADNAARKRYAPEICELRGKDFTLKVTFQGHEDRVAPTRYEMNRKLYCKQAGDFSRIRQYRLERKSIDIDLADDRKTAVVKADYLETQPYYEPHTRPATPDDFHEWQLVETQDESVVGIEGGEVVFQSTKSNSSQALAPKNSISLPYD